MYELSRGHEALRSIDELCAAIRFQRNLSTADGRMDPVRGAEITVSAFRLARVAPLLGRTLETSDEEANAAPAAVIGYSLWQSLFGGKPGAIGERIKLGSVNATVIGVMPEGFAFPFSEQIWTPLRLDPQQFGATGKAGTGFRSASLLGRLATGISLAEAQAELDGIAGRLGPNSPQALRETGPRIIPYGQTLLMLWGRMTTTIGVNVGLLLLAIGIMLTAGLVACAAPLRRALRLNPTEALRREG